MAAADLVSLPSLGRDKWATGSGNSMSGVTSVSLLVPKLHFAYLRVITLPHCNGELP